MAVLKPRERLVYFRITEDEFHQFAGVCERAGARSISDLARNAVQRFITQGEHEQQNQELAPKMQSLERLIAEVTAQLQMLRSLRVSVAGEGSANPSAQAPIADAKPAAEDGGGKE